MIVLHDPQEESWPPSTSPFMDEIKARVLFQATQVPQADSS